MLTTYFGALGDNLTLTTQLTTAGLHIDLVRALQQLDSVLAQILENKILSVGVVNGRNVWRTNLDAALETVQKVVNVLGRDRVRIAPSCSLLFSPHNLTLENGTRYELKSWLAFARQKLAELVLLKKAVSGGNVDEVFAANRAAIEIRRTSTRTFNPQVRERQGQVSQEMLNRANIYSLLKLPEPMRLA